MKSLFTLIGILIVIAAVGALFYGGYLGAVYLLHVFAELETVIRIVLLSVGAVMLISALIVAGAIKTASFAANTGQLVDAKLRLYKSLVEIYKPYFVSPDQPPHQVYSDVLTNLSEIKTEMQILSGGTVLGIHQKLEAALQNRDDGEQVKILFQKLIKSIRRDLGHGSNFDESKLTFLINSSRVENTESVDHNVSA